MIDHPFITFVSIDDNVERVDAVIDSAEVPEPARHVVTSLGSIPVVKVIKRFMNGAVEVRMLGPGNLLLRTVVWHALPA